MSIWYTRWMIVPAISLIWWSYPRTMYIMMCIIDLLMLVLGVLTMGGFHGPLGILFVVEEFFLLFWHFSQFILMIDYYAADDEAIGKMSTGGTKLWVYFIFFSTIICLLLELTIFALGVFVPEKGASSSAGGAIESDDFGLSDSGGELDNNLQTYKTMKTGKKGGGTAILGGQQVQVR